ncbi:hypothetical protein ACWD4O_10330 [Streptomyces sp. NPDC002623]
MTDSLTDQQLEEIEAHRMTTDLRALKLAQHRQRIAHEGISYLPAWNDLTDVEREQSTREAATWLRAAVEAGIAPAAERPTPEHNAVWIDDEGFLYGEYQTSPPSHGDAILRLVWASEQCTSKREMEEHGIEFRLIGWSA